MTNSTITSGDIMRMRLDGAPERLGQSREEEK